MCKGCTMAVGFSSHSYLCRFQVVGNTALPSQQQVNSTAGVGEGRKEHLMHPRNLVVRSCPIMSRRRLDYMLISDERLWVSIDSVLFMGFNMQSKAIGAICKASLRGLDAPLQVVSLEWVTRMIIGFHLGSPSLLKGTQHSLTKRIWTWSGNV